MNKSVAMAADKDTQIDHVGTQEHSCWANSSPAELCTSAKKLMFTCSTRLTVDGSGTRGSTEQTFFCNVSMTLWQSSSNTGIGNGCFFFTGNHLHNHYTNTVLINGVGAK